MELPLVREGWVFGLPIFHCRQTLCETSAAVRTKWIYLDHMASVKSEVQTAATKSPQAQHVQTTLFAALFTLLCLFAGRHHHLHSSSMSFLSASRGSLVTRSISSTYFSGLPLVPITVIHFKEPALILDDLHVHFDYETPVLST